MDSLEMDPNPFVQSPMGCEEMQDKGYMGCDLGHQAEFVASGEALLALVLVG
jgi:hypothetical protein